MSELQKPKCEECFWFDKEHESLKDVANGFGYCRAALPIPATVDNRLFGGWPLVDERDFCKEFTIGG